MSNSGPPYGGGGSYASLHDLDTAHHDQRELIKKKVQEAQARHAQRQLDANEGRPQQRTPSSVTRAGTPWICSRLPTGTKEGTSRLKFSRSIIRVTHPMSRTSLFCTSIFRTSPFNSPILLCPSKPSLFRKLR
ncbi:hypothetical protein JCM1840_005297 [Sporobolomyces johnsonii]